MTTPALIEKKQVIEREDGVPLYMQIKAWVESRIKAGELGEGAKIPSEKDLGALFQASSGTVRKAMDSLEQSGVINRFRGRGTFVADQQGSLEEKGGYRWVVMWGTDGSNRIMPIRGMRRFAEEVGASLVVEQFVVEDGKILEAVKRHLAMGVNGFVIEMDIIDGPDGKLDRVQQHNLDMHIQAVDLIRNAGKKVVLVGGATTHALDQIPVSYVCSNYYKAAEELGQYLRLMKHENAVYCRVGRFSYHFHQRMCESLVKGGIGLDESNILVAPSHEVDLMRDMVREVLQSDRRPTVVITHSDWEAIVVYQTARKLGLSVPRDLSVVSMLVRDSSLLKLLEPQLTVWCGLESAVIWGYEAMQVLFRLQNNAWPEEKREAAIPMMPSMGGSVVAALSFD